MSETRDGTVSSTEGDVLNKTHVGTPLPTTDHPITMLAVPKAWTRIMIISLVVEGMILALVSIMVYVTHQTSRDNTDRIIQQQRQIEGLQNDLKDKQEKK